MALVVLCIYSLHEIPGFPWCHFSVSFHELQLHILLHYDVEGSYLIAEYNAKFEIVLLAIKYVMATSRSTASTQLQYINQVL